jgi:uncharacterized protein (DUF779 family)
MSVTTTTSKIHQAPGHADSWVRLKPRYENFAAVWKHNQLIIDVGPGEPEGFLLPVGDDQYFISRSRVSSPAEQAVLAEGERQP